MELEITRLSKSFARPVFADASARLLESAGSGVVLSGPNGCGKSTLLKLVAGVLLPDAGQVLLDHRPALRQRERIGYCPSSSAGFYRRLTARQNLQHFGALYGLHPRSIDRAIGALELFGIQYWDEPAENLSDGMLQKVKILRAFLHDPELVLLDEPLNYLDAASKASFLEWLGTWARAKAGRAYLLAQHSPDLPGTHWAIADRGLRPVGRA